MATSLNINKNFNNSSLPFTYKLLFLLTKNTKNINISPINIIMDTTKFNGQSGTIIVGNDIIDGSEQKYGYFLPKELPHKITLPSETQKKLDNANISIGELKGVAKYISKKKLDLIIRAYKRREAWLSTKIEGTNVSLTDVFLNEAGSLEKRGYKDIQEIKNYIHSLNISLERLSNGREINKDLLNEMHQNLLEGVRGKDRLLGQYRKVQNWVDGKTWQIASFIPPPPNKVDDLMKYLFFFMEEQDDLSILIKIGLMHYYFETIHPYEDGNGRLGRTLIVLYLRKTGIIEIPILYISAFFEKNNRQYRELLMKVRECGDYLSWIDFFLEGIYQTSKDTSEKIKKLIELYELYHIKLEEINANTISFTLLDLFFENPFLSIPYIQVLIEKNYPLIKHNYPLIKRGIDNLLKVKFIEEYTYQKRNKFYEAREVERILESDLLSTPQTPDIYSE